MSTTKHLLDPELQVMADAPFIPELTDDNISKARDNMAAKAVGLADPASHNVHRTEIFAVQPDGQRCAACSINLKLTRIKLEQGTCIFMEAVIYLALPMGLIFRTC